MWKAIGNPADLPGPFSVPFAGDYGDDGAAGDGAADLEQGWIVFEGAWYDPNTGRYYDIETGREIDPDTGEPIDYDNDSCEVDRSLCDDDQRQKIEPSESEIWNGLDSWRGKTKTNGESGKKRRYFEWDYTHGEIEVYDRRGNHLGAIDPRSGELIKEAVDGRSIDVS